MAGCGHVLVAPGLEASAAGHGHVPGAVRQAASAVECGHVLVAPGMALSAVGHGRAPGAVELATNVVECGHALVAAERGASGVIGWVVVVVVAKAMAMIANQSTILLRSAMTQIAVGLALDLSKRWLATVSIVGVVMGPRTTTTVA